MKFRLALTSLMLLVTAASVRSAAPGSGPDIATFPGPVPKNPPIAKGKVVTADDGIEGSYIITYKAGTSAQSKGVGLEAKGKRLHRMETMNVVTVEGLTNEDVKALEMDDDVERVEQDQTCSVSCREKAYNTNLWGLDRIDQSGTTYDNKMFIDKSGRSMNVHVYVLDTGVDDDHPDFMGRAKQVYSVIDGETTDGHGHGTHCAGTIAGANFGVSKKARIRGVKVLANSGSGSYSGVIKGIDFVIRKHSRRTRRTGGKARTVISMSLGGGRSQSVNDAIKRATDAGIPCVVAAGNSGNDARYYSPASAPEALTVAASDKYDNFASFSNWGDLIDIVAPGVSITSAFPSECANPPPKNEVPDLSHPCMTTRTWSGTSMATPHMAGIIANYLKTLRRQDPMPPVADIFTWVKNNADQDAIHSPPSMTTPDVGQVKRCQNGQSLDAELDE